MNREAILSTIRVLMEGEQRRGIRYWCDPDLADALRASLVRPTASTPRPGATTAGPSARPVLSPEPVRSGANAPRRFARPPARLDPDAPARSSPARPTAEPKGVRPNWGPAPAATGREDGWEEKLAAIEAEVKGCTNCSLSDGRTNTVFGVGAARVPLVFVGEAPGAEEDRQGFPFVGRAGALLTRIIEAIGLTRDEVYICNVLKCRPPGNRDPDPDEIATCAPYLDRQLALLKPKVICALGRYSTLWLTGESLAMKALHGQVFRYRGFQVVPTYHPAALLRNPSLKVLVWEDVQKLRALLDAE